MSSEPSDSPLSFDATDPSAAEKLLPLVYRELRELAAAKLLRENPGQTLNATDLVHEAYLRLIGYRAFVDKQHFFRVAAEAMRRILIDRARRKERLKHGGGRERVQLDDVAIADDTPVEQLLALDAALDRLAESDPVKAELVKLRYFAGLSEEEAATALGISRATASRYWTFSRAWLIQEIEEEGK
jgi:RNA polymerase sigma factor (TIGR02999 family)